MFPTFFSKPCFEFFWGNFLGCILTSWFVSLRNQITLYFNIVEDVEAVTKFATYQGEWHSYYGPCRDLQFEYKRQDKMVWLLNIIVSYLEIFTSQRKEPVCPPPVRINHWWYLLPNNWNSSLLPSSSLLLPHIFWLPLYTSASTFFRTFFLCHNHQINNIGGLSPL